METYDPSAIVLQCGTDSLSGDKLGCLNLSMKGHANCVKFVKSFNKPLLLLGGGGYTMRNVSRAWAFETGLATGVELAPCKYLYSRDISLTQLMRRRPLTAIPVNEYYEYFGPNYELDVKSSNADDLNTPAYLDRVKRIVLENLRHTGGAPSTQMSGTSITRGAVNIILTLFSDIPSMPIDDDLEDPNRDEDMDDPNERRPQRLLDSRRQADGELSDSDDEGEDDRRNHESHKDLDMLNREGVGHKFGMNIGILASQQNPTHGAGPSGHNTMVRVLSKAGEEDASMEVDSPSSSGAAEAAAPPAGPSTATVVAAVTPDAVMPVDDPKNPEDVKPVIESSPKADPPL